jgi:feruloyl-CoA synthase
MKNADASVFADPDIALEAIGNGRWRLRSRVPLDPPSRQVGDWVRRWAAAAPDRVMLADKPADATAGTQWRTRGYAEARAEIDRLSAALLARGLSQERPLAILSDKSLRHGLLQLAALQVGIPVSPVSPAYSLRPEAHARLMQCLDVLRPGMIYIEDGPPFDAALRIAGEALGRLPEIVYGDRPPSSGATAYDRFLEAAPDSGIDAEFDAVGPQTPGKIMFTSGSTGPPKAVIVTHGNMTANQAAMGQVYPFLRAGPPVVVDWQPWHHCGGGVYNWHAALAHGGSYYCDLGRPTADRIGTTLDNLDGLHPTVHFNVPLGYDLLMGAFESAPERAGDFFRDLRLLIYSAAGMPMSLWRRMQAVAEAATGAPVPMVSSYGMTEMAPMHTTVHMHQEVPGRIGVPVPGSEVLLVPAPDNPEGALDGRFELRGKGPNLTPGYYRQPELTAAAFDDEGWFRTGDAVRLVDPVDANAGLLLEGRLVEEFKLGTGTWVSVGDVRTAVVSHTAPLVQDVLVVGENRPMLGLLVFLGLDACRAVSGDPALTLAAAAETAAVKAAISERLSAYNAAFPASSRRIGRALLLDHLPSFAAGETTDKGYINQRLARANRAEAVARLYAEDVERDKSSILL